jgi:hypothetical protein
MMNEMTRANDDELARLRRAFTAPAGLAPDPADCPPADRIWLAVRGELPPAEMRALVEHMAVCSACAEDWRIAVAFEKESRAVPDHAYQPARSIVARIRPWLTAAAAALVLTVAGIELHQPQKPAIYRGVNQTVESPLAADEALPRERFVLDWNPVPGAATYDLVVSTKGLRTLANPQGLTATQYQVPASALAGLPSGTEISWRVTPISQDGGTLQASTFRNKIR